MNTTLAFLATKSRWNRLQDEQPVDLGGPVPVELVERLEHREPCLLDAALHAAVFARGSLAGDQLGQVVQVAVHAAGMAGDELVAVVDAHALGVGLERQGQAGVARGHRVVVAVERDAELLGGAHAAHPGQIVVGRVEPVQMGAFALEAVGGTFVGGGMDAHIGHRVHPGGGPGLHGREVGQLQAGQQVLLDVAHAVLDPPLLHHPTKQASWGPRSLPARTLQGEILKPQCSEKSRYFVSFRQGLPGTPCVAGGRLPAGQAADGPPCPRAGATRAGVADRQWRLRTSCAPDQARERTPPRDPAGSDRA